ncbi:MAG: hypothetical protein J6U51_07455 [Bacteroidales bacterium]|nr:hypothetical protein [Bacteroidales bacterium]
MEQRIDIKPLSVNEAWQGKRFKTREYSGYEKEMLLKLKPGRLPDPPFEVWYEWGFSNMQADVGNPEKCVSDILQKKYGFNDNKIIRMHLHKVKVRKGEEYVRFRIEHCEE